MRPYSPACIHNPALLPTTGPRPYSASIAKLPSLDDLRLSLFPTKCVALMRWNWGETVRVTKRNPRLLSFDVPLLTVPVFRRTNSSTQISSLYCSGGSTPCALYLSMYASRLERNTLNSPLPISPVPIRSSDPTEPTLRSQSYTAKEIFGDTVGSMKKFIWVLNSGNAPLSTSVLSHSGGWPQVNFSPSGPQVVSASVGSPTLTLTYGSPDLTRSVDASLAPRLTWMPSSKLSVSRSTFSSLAGTVLFASAHAAFQRALAPADWAVWYLFSSSCCAFRASRNLSRPAQMAALRFISNTARCCLKSSVKRVSTRRRTVMTPPRSAVSTFFTRPTGALAGNSRCRTGLVLPSGCSLHLTPES
mmetsp:Transcript_33818/g.77284  ORF Transcript_33818/g.77284 Transcript_33818/m.77284 type:complete len:360 (-) Transcript_33818:3681-4760(-)